MKQELKGKHTENSIINIHNKSDDSYSKGDKHNEGESICCDIPIWKIIFHSILIKMFIVDLNC